MDERLRPANPSQADLPVAAMSTNSTFSLRRYSLFRRDSPIELTPPAPLIVQSIHANYYIAAACVLLFTLVLRAGRRKDGVNAPFYKASKMKWIFDAETLIRDSYNKVRTLVLSVDACLLIVST